MSHQIFGHFPPAFLTHMDWKPQNSNLQVKSFDIRSPCTQAPVETRVHWHFEDGSFTWVVHPGLNDVIQGKSAGGLFVPKAWVHLERQHLRHVVVVLAEVWILLLSGEVHLQLIVSVTERHGCVYLVQIFGNKDALKVNSNPIQVQGQSQPLSCIIVVT